jgi:hypothetical protein
MYDTLNATGTEMAVRRVLETQEVQLGDVGLRAARALGPAAVRSGRQLRRSDAVVAVHDLDAHLREERGDRLAVLPVFELPFELLLDARDGLRRQVDGFGDCRHPAPLPTTQLANSRVGDRLFASLELQGLHDGWGWLHHLGGGP